MENTENDFRSHVLQMVNEYRCSSGKQPNELHIPIEYQSAYEEIVDEFNSRAVPTKADVYGDRKHWWFMGLRVFYGQWSDFVRYTEETGKLKQKLKVA